MLQFDSNHFEEEDEGGGLCASASSLDLHPDQRGIWPSKFEVAFRDGGFREFNLVNLACNEEGEVQYALYTEAYESKPLQIKILNN